MCSNCAENPYDHEPDSLCFYCQLGRHKDCVGPECSCERCSEARIKSAIENYKGERND